jgi:hypothetical protein
VAEELMALDVLGLVEPTRGLAGEVALSLWQENERRPVIGGVGGLAAPDA